jgi:GNAT superfamily N-acetyltransferase
MSGAGPLRGPDPLTEAHDTGDFDCGHGALNVFIKRFALVSQQSGAVRTYVALRDGRVVGYYSLSAAAAEPVTVPSRVSKGLARHPIPMTLLARLAVDVSEQRHGLGEALLKDAFKRFLQAADIIGSRALVVHAKDEAAVAFYARFGFEPSPIDRFHLYLLTKDIRRTLGR